MFTCSISTARSHHLTDLIANAMGRVNICPYQGSRTIRTEEAVLITLSRLSPFVAKNAVSDKLEQSNNDVTKRTAAISEDIVFSDDAVSDESSEEEE